MTSLATLEVFDSTTFVTLSTSGFPENVSKLENLTETYQRPFTESAVILSAAILLTFLFLGLITNILTIVVIATKPNLLKNAFMMFIVSLCVSDLLSSLISWLCLYRRTWGFDDWAPLPRIFCRFYWASDLMTSYATALHVFSFAILRFIAIQFPLKFAKIQTKHVKIWISLIWGFTFCLGFIPFFIFFDARQRNRLSDSPDARWPACTITMEWYKTYTIYQTIGYSAFLYAPTVGIVIVSILIGITATARASKMAAKMRKKQHQAVAQLVLIVISFLIGYIPFTAYEFWSVQPHPNTQYYKHVDYWFGMIQYYFLRFSECLNPVFYNLGSSKLRYYTVGFLKQKLFCCEAAHLDRPSSTETGDLSRTARAASRQKSLPIL